MFSIVYMRSMFRYSFWDINPQLNTPEELWYSAPHVFIFVDDTIIWYNDDQQDYTVTSGEGSGR